MGDCGAFSYINDDVPPYRPDEVIDFYDECGFDFGISIDHIIFGYDPAAEEWRRSSATREVGGPPATDA